MLKVLFLIFLSAAIANAQNSDLKLPNGEPVLRMPFPAGSVLLCQQGNRSPEGFSHSLNNCLHAIDFSNPLVASQDVAAAAGGTVADLFAESKPGDHKAGYGFGNYVKIDHGGGYFTLYAHLDAVSVKLGDKVASGEKLGTMGDTGNAGNKHLHFSLHRGNAKTSGVIDTVPMHGLIAVDISRSGEIELLTSLELVGAGAKISPKGYLYGSENEVGKQAIFGKPGGELAALLSTAKDKLAGLLNEAASFENVQSILEEWPRRGARWAREQLDAIAAKNNRDFLALYWSAVASQRDLNDQEHAKKALQKIKAAEPKFPLWLLPWTYFRLGLIAKSDGLKSEAIANFRKALGFVDDGTGFFSAARQELNNLETDGSK